jgi:hypothetical protein
MIQVDTTAAILVGYYAGLIGYITAGVVLWRTLGRDRLSRAQDRTDDAVVEMYRAAQVAADTWFTDHQLIRPATRRRLAAASRLAGHRSSRTDDRLSRIIHELNAWLVTRSDLSENPSKGVALGINHDIDPNAELALNALALEIVADAWLESREDFARSDWSAGKAISKAKLRAQRPLYQS